MATSAVVEGAELAKDQQNVSMTAKVPQGH